MNIEVDLLGQGFTCDECEQPAWFEFDITTEGVFYYCGEHLAVALQLPDGGTIKLFGVRDSGAVPDNV